MNRTFSRNGLTRLRPSGTDGGRMYVAVALLMGLLYLLAASRNPSGDSLAYAVCAMSGEDLLWPHHLLYVPLCRCVVEAFSFTGIEPLCLLQGMNAVMAMMCLLLVGRMLRLAGRDAVTTSGVVAFCGSCFGVMRFATDNEVYVLWMLMGLSAMLFMEKYLIEERPRQLLMLSLFAVLSCLAHQLGILIWIPTAMMLAAWGLKERCLGSRLVPFLGVSLLIPVVYVAANGGFDGLVRFVMHDYYSGTAGGPVLRQVLLLTPISLVRSFVQVHASTVAFMHAHVVLFALFAVFLLAMAVVALRGLFPIKRLDHDKLFVRYCESVLVLVVLFAAFSNGNAEFMTLVPVLAAVILSLVVDTRYGWLWLSAGLLAWNLQFGLLMQRRPDLRTDRQLVEFIHQHPQFEYRLQDTPPIENLYNYRYFPQQMPQNDCPLVLADELVGAGFTRGTMTRNDGVGPVEGEEVVRFESFTETRRLVLFEKTDL